MGLPLAAGGLQRRHFWIYDLGFTIYELTDK